MKPLPTLEIAHLAVAGLFASFSFFAEATRLPPGDSQVVSPALGNLSAPTNPQTRAARLLSQGTFGADIAEINRVTSLGPAPWVEEQFAKPSVSFKSEVKSLMSAGREGWEVMSPVIWKRWIEGDDQLRQRVVYALSQIMVISLNQDILLNQACGPASWLDMLGVHAFGNFRDLLKEMTLHPAMGQYLDMNRSAKNTSTTNYGGQVYQEYPNENYARELLQLFSIGTVKLNLNGTMQLDANGRPIASYDEAVVKGFSKAFTGYTFAPEARDGDRAQPWRWTYDFWPSDTVYPNLVDRVDIFCEKWTRPMQVWTGAREQPGKWDICDSNNPKGPYPACTKVDLPAPHDTGAKQLLNGVILPANQTPAKDLEDAIDNIFNHANVGPFIGKQLIQRLVTSNPKPDYVERVATAFNNNGFGVRGDMKAVIRAILLDREALNDDLAAHPDYGKVREPVVRFVQAHRAFNARPASGFYDSWNLSDPGENLGQMPLYAPSVFNFYHPDYKPQGILGSRNLIAPEMEITTTTAVVGYANFSSWGMVGGFQKWDSAKHWAPNLTEYLSLAATPSALVDRLSLLFLHGRMSASFRGDLINSISKIPSNEANYLRERVDVALWLVFNSPEYLIQR